jgi:hypothetical protein
MSDLGNAWIERAPSEVPRDQWQAFFESFSREHENRVISVEVASGIGRVFEVEQLALKGISIDHADGNERIYVQMGDHSQEHVTHMVKSPTSVRLTAGPQEELDIASADGRTTVIRLIQ